MTLGKGKQIVIYQGWYHRPIEATQESYYEGKTDIQKNIAAKVNMGESAPMPEFLVSNHCRAMGYTGQIRFMDPTTKTIRVLSE